MRALAPGLAIAALCALFSALFVARHVAAERWLYSWDQVGYWARVATLERELRDLGPAAVAVEVVRSVRAEDYNLLAAALLLPATLVFGVSRLGYELAIVATFALPASALFVALALALRARRGAPSPALACFVAAAMFALVPQVWVPILVGQPDVAGVAIAFALFLIALPAPASASLARAAAAGALLALLVLLRRWYAFWVAGFAAGLAARAALEAASAESADSAMRGRVLRRGASWIALCLAVAALAILFAAGPAVWRMLATDYVLAFAGYRGTGGLRGSLAALLAYLGGLLPALAAAGAGLGLADRRERGFTALVVVQLGASLLLFLRVQELDLHHFYLLLPGLLVLGALALLHALGALAGAAQGWLVALATAAALALGFASMMVPPAAGLVALAPLVPSLQGRPQQRGDLAEVERLLRTLDALSSAAVGGRVYVLSSSLELNDDLLRWAWLGRPGWPNLGDRLLVSHHVDLRDGVPAAELRMARLVVVSDPIGFHLSPAHQRVIAVPAAQILGGVGIGRAFRRRPEEFRLDHGVVRIFERVSDITDEDLAALAAEIGAGHPGHEGMFALDRGGRG